MNKRRDIIMALSVAQPSKPAQPTRRLIDLTSEGRSQLFTRSGHWDHKLAVLLGDEISHRARRAFGAFLIDRDH